MDVICQAKSGMGKTAVFVLTTLQQLDLTQSGDVLMLCLCHTRELAFQIQKEYDRFSKYLPDVSAVRLAMFFYLLTQRPRERGQASRRHANMTASAPPLHPAPVRQSHSSSLRFSTAESTSSSTRTC